MLRLRLASLQGNQIFPNLPSYVPLCLVCNVSWLPPPRKKRLLTAQMLARMVDSVGENPTVADSTCRLLALASFLSFSAFLRFDELSHLCCSDIVFEEDKMLIHIASSKTDQWREGAFVRVARSGTNTCPVKILEQYYSLGNIDNSSSEALPCICQHEKWLFP